MHKPLNELKKDLLANSLLKINEIDILVNNELSKIRIFFSDEINQIIKAGKLTKQNLENIKNFYTSHPILSISKKINSISSVQEFINDAKIKNQFMIKIDFNSKKEVFSPLYKVWLVQKKCEFFATNFLTFTVNVFLKIRKKEPRKLKDIYKKYHPNIFIKNNLFPQLSHSLHELHKHSIFVIQQYLDENKVTIENVMCLELKHMTQLEPQSETNLNPEKLHAELNETFNTIVKSLATFKENTILKINHLIESSFSKNDVILGTWIYQLDYLKRVSSNLKCNFKLYSLSKYTKSLNQYHSFFINDISDDITLFKLGLDITYSIDQQISEINNHYNEKISTIFKETTEIIENHSQKIRSNPNLNSESFISNLRRINLSRILQYIFEKKLLSLKNQLKNQLKNNLHSLPPEHVIVYHKKLGQKHIKYSTQTLSVRQLLNATVYPVLNQFESDEMKQLQQNEKKLPFEVNEFDTILDFYVNDIKKGLITEEKNESAKEIDDGVNRAIIKLQEIHTDYKELIDEYILQLEKIKTTLIIQLLKTLNQEEVLLLKGKIILAHYFNRTSDILFNSSEKGLRVSRVLLNKSKNLTSISIQNISLLIEKSWRLLVGLQPSTETQYIMSDVSGSFQKKYQEVPGIYRFLFSLDPVNEKRFFIGRENEFSQLSSSYQNWENGNYESVALIGAKGEGKSSLINIFKKDVCQDLKVLDLYNTITKEEELCRLISETLGMSTLTTLNEISEKLNSNDETYVCFIENFHNTFLKSIDGLKLIEKVLFFISQTSKKVFWGITCNTYSWRYLDKTIDIAYPFRKIIYLNQMGGKDIQNLILKRHDISGYIMNFESELINKNRKWYSFNKPMTEEEEEDNFFDKFSKDVDGNPKLALFTWLNNIEFVDSKSIKVKNKKLINLAPFMSLNKSELFTLQSLLEHDNLTSEEHEKVLNISSDESFKRLNILVAKGFISRSNDFYRIIPIYCETVFKVLKSKNYV